MNCDHCGKTVNPNAKFCGKCGAFLNLVKKVQAQSEQSQPLSQSNASPQASLDTAPEIAQEHNLGVKPVPDQVHSEHDFANAAVAAVDSHSHAPSIESTLGEHSEGAASSQTPTGASVIDLPLGEDHLRADVEHHAQAVQLVQAAQADQAPQVPSAEPTHPLDPSVLTLANTIPSEEIVQREDVVPSGHLELNEASGPTAHSHLNASQTSAEQSHSPMNPSSVQPEVTLDTADSVQALQLESLQKQSLQEVHASEPLAHDNLGVSASTQELLEPDAQDMISPSLQQGEAVNIERMAPVLDNPIPSMGAEFAQMLDSMSQSLSAMRLEMDQKVAEIKADAHATAQALAQRIYITQQANQPPDFSALNARMEQIKSELSSSMGQLKEHQSATAQALVNKNADDMQAIMAAEFKKIQTGIVNLYNTQQNTVVQTNASFEQALDALTFKIQNIENFVNSQLSAQAQAQASAVAANKSIGTAINEIRSQLQEQQELLSGLTIDPALIKTMNSFNINFRKQQEMMAAQAQRSADEAKSKKSEGVSISDTVVMWFIGFLCGLTLLLGGISIYNYSSAQSLKSQMHKRAEDGAQVSEQVRQPVEDESAHKAEKAVPSNVTAHPEPEAVNAEKKAESAEMPDMKTMHKDSDKALEKTAEKTNEKASDHSADKGGEKAADHHLDKESAKKHGSSEKE